MEEKFGLQIQTNRYTMTGILRGHIKFTPETSGRRVDSTMRLRRGNNQYTKTALNQLVCDIFNKRFHHSACTSTSEGVVRISVRI